MLPYPNYSMNNMPMYQPMQNSYLDNRMSYLQSVQQNLQPQQMPQPNFGINGRIVDDFNSITANDVPMDNFGAVFVKSDGTEIQRKAWDKNGRIVTMAFKAAVSDFEQQTEILSTGKEKDGTEALNKAVDGLNKKIDDLFLKVDEILKYKVPTKSKKEADLNE